jgi:hypothetical protein
MIRIDKLLALLALLANFLYITWLGFNYQGNLGLFLYFIDVGFTILIVLYLINHWCHSYVIKSPIQQSGTLDIFLPVVNEPLEIFESTVEAAVNINHDSMINDIYNYRATTINFPVFLY